MAEKDEERREKRICPRCGQEYTVPGALSREDNKTMICSDCGTLEALASIGVQPDEAKHILEIIHQHTNQGQCD